MLKEFREFAMRGPVMDLAIGVIIGAAFGKVISSFVGDILMGPIGMLAGKVNFNDLYVNLSGTTYPTLEAAKAAGAPTINYGTFLTTMLDFIIVAFAIFMVVRAINRMQKPVVAEVTTKSCDFCCTEIPLDAKRCPNCTSELAA